MSPMSLTTHHVILRPSLIIVNAANMKGSGRCAHEYGQIDGSNEEFVLRLAMLASQFRLGDYHNHGTCSV